MKVKDIDAMTGALRDVLYEDAAWNVERQRYEIEVDWIEDLAILVLDKFNAGKGAK